jgi:CobQ-like glutamine amidotransferase family enzyme
MYELNICHLYPELFNLYGDGGNVISLRKRAEWRGITVNVINIALGDSFIPENYDIVFMGGSRDYEREIIKNDFLKFKGNGIRNAIENNKTFFCMCGSYQLLGKYHKCVNGEELEFLGAIDLWTLDGEKRITGNIVFKCEFLTSENHDGKVVGFENHTGKTYLGQGVRPMGNVIKGFGNNGEDNSEGIVYKNVYCSNSWGSLLPQNPALADHLIEIALKQKYLNFSCLDCLNDELEELARNSMIKKIIG